MAEIPARGEKRKVEEESESVSVLKEGDGVEGSNEYVVRTFIGEDGEEYYDSDDDLIRYGDGRRMSIRLQNEYNRQVKESEGFDITLDLTLGTGIGAPIIPQRGNESDPVFVDLSRKAIKDFNSQQDTNYKFVENVTVNTSFASGMWCYITFKAINDDDSTTPKTFQALAWWGIDGETEVDFCRLKKPCD